ncbi:GNAT family N-acetyltransferase [Herbihabitans rhizosphaerae]|uniref:GNAT family N-acetyltransferase n=1 Tax=Herbihabitans rhizosphaerae TaxID=1872711 RepID=UPI001F5F0377|nr:GNAT family N-acetyltransferase [Herbihabitans rhizosphaerae]
MLIWSPPRQRWAELVPIEEAADGMFAEHGITFPPGNFLDFGSTVDSVLADGDPPVGFAALGPVDGGTHLYQLAVHPAHGRRGHGSALLRAVVAKASDGVTLTTFRDVPWNAPWYVREGFEVYQPAPASGVALILEHERDAGLFELGARVAMRRRPPTGG